MKEKEFLKIFEPISHKLFGFALRILKNSDEANDALQDVLLKLWKMKKKLNHEENIEAYSFKMMNNHCIDKLRSKKRIISYSFDDGKTVPESFSDNKDYEDIDMLERVREEVDKLPHKQKVIVELRDFQGYSYEDISQMTNMTVNAVRVNISRARTRIIEKFERED